MEPSASIPELTKLLHKGARLAYKREEAICNTETMDALYQVGSGFVKRFEIMNNGTINVQGIYGPGDIFSLSYIFKLLRNQDIYKGPETYYYEALGETIVYKLPGELLKEAVEKNLILYRDLFSLSGNRFVSNIQLLENQSLPTAEKRVAHLLTFYIDRYGKRMNTGVHLIAPLTQQDIADILSLTRETVSLAISSMREQGLLTDARKLVVPSPDKLRTLAYE